MKRLILGTAGHIDHGKTALIKALTGIDTDRLKEEKERGITIELGFAYLDLPSGERLGIIDVPGHEKFVKNMVAGSGGIDITALVIAADEGIMPQTEEHLNILRLLDVRLGLIVITKVDLAEEEFCDLVIEEVKEFVAGTFLENAPIVKVSAITGEGIDELKKTLDDLVHKIEGRGASGIFRLPVDRVFSMKGFGTVITGTLLSGGVKTGEEVEISPTGIRAKIRGVQVHGEKADEAIAGTRTAINLSGVDRDQLKRGDVLISPGSVEPTYMIDTQLQYLPGAPRKLLNRERVRFHIGTSEVLSNIVLIDREELTPGEEAYVQIRLTEPVVALPTDRFVIRSLSPVNTIGGGEILNAHPKKHKRFTEAVIEDFETLILGSLRDRAAVFLKDTGYAGITAEGLKRRMGSTVSEATKLLTELAGEGIAAVIDKEKERFLDEEAYSRLKEITIGLMGSYHEKKPTQKGIPKEELANKMPWGVDAKLFSKLLADLSKEGKVSISGDRVADAGHAVSFSKEEEELLKKAGVLISQGKLSPPSTQELSERLSAPEDEIKKLLEVKARDGELVRVKENLYFTPDAIEALEGKLIGYLTETGEISTQAMKDLTGVSRKYTIPLLEYFDRKKVTIRIGDVRKLRERAGG
jgi:selenocysteine-specific elongation factor